MFLEEKTVTQLKLPLYNRLPACSSKFAWRPSPCCIHQSKASRAYILNTQLFSLFVGLTLKAYIPCQNTYKYPSLTSPYWEALLRAYGGGVLAYCGICKALRFTWLTSSYGDLLGESTVFQANYQSAELCIDIISVLISENQQIVVHSYNTSISKLFCEIWSIFYILQISKPVENLLLFEVSLLDRNFSSSG